MPAKALRIVLLLTVVSFQSSVPAQDTGAPLPASGRTEFRSALQVSIRDWEKTKGVVIVPQERTRIFDELDGAAFEFERRNGDKIKNAEIQKEVPTIVSIYLDSLRTDENVVSPESLFSERILRLQSLGYPVPNRRGTLRITVAAPPPKFVMIDNLDMIPDIAYMLTTGNHNVKVGANPGLVCDKDLTIQSGRESAIVCP